MEKKILIEGKVALVTGANRGIGKEFTIELLNKGAKVLEKLGFEFKRQPGSLLRKKLLMSKVTTPNNCKLLSFCRVFS